MDIEERTQQLGRELLAEAGRYRPGPAERVQDWLLGLTAANERFRGRLLRYLDVLASVDHDSSGAEAKRLAAEYFGDEFPELPRGLRWLLRLARDERVPARVMGESSRRAAELFARRFITPPGTDAVRETTRQLRGHGRFPSFDLLGEAVLSDREAEAYLARYLALIGQLGDDPAAGEVTPGGVFALQVSLKLSSLTAHFSPVDPEGTIARARPPLEAIVEAADRAGVGVTVDMEQFEYRDLTWELFTRTFARGARFGAWPGAGIVLQGYLREAAAHADAMVAFARDRGVPYQVRLVKGAYWDYETIVADAARWTPPVFTRKAATDATFEAVLARLVGAHPALHVAVGSHNARAHALAEALAEASGLAEQAVEHQTLFRTAEGTSRALAQLGWAARDYVPSGELLPGMAYLVRRVLENSSQAGVLLAGRTGASPEDLLRPPPALDPPPPRPSDGFERAPEARWFDPAFRDAFAAALDSARARWGDRFPLRAGGAEAPSNETVAVHSPSHPGGEPVGFAEFADAEGARRAVAVAAGGAADWAATPVEERASVLRRAADLLAERGHEFAAWIVHEGGRDRAGAWTEVEEAVDYLRYYASQAEALFKDFGDRIAPRGVVAVIPPWNFPLAIPCGMTAAALASGNAAILKPAEQTPLLGHRLAALLHEAGVPLAALIALPGRGETAGATLAGSPDVATVAFTGSRAVGTLLHDVVSCVEPSGEVATKTLVAEMGGKNAIVVFADADPDEVVDGVMRSAFGHANQKCSAASRVLIAQPVYEAIRDRLVEAARSLRTGPADAPDTQINPVIDAEARDRLIRDASTARSECGVLLDRFEESSGDGDLALGPLVVQLSASRALDARTTTEELFGPILALIPFATEEEAYAVVNGTDYGLTAGIFSRSPATIERAARAIEAGNVYANRAITAARVGVEPFGGMKMSGTGPKAGGSDSLWAFVRRTDAPEDAPAVPAPMSSNRTAPAPNLPAGGWDAPLETRVEVVEMAAVLLGNDGRYEDAGALLAAAQAARRELGRPQPTIRVAGQRTELRYDTPRGVGLLHAAGREAAWWLAAPLLAGNSLALFDSRGLYPVTAALLRAGLPPEVMRPDPGGLGAMLAAARRPEVAFAATDGGAVLEQALHRELGPTADGQRSPKALLSRLDGPQAGEPGFVQRFAWPKVVAVRTLRHGADLGLDPVEAGERRR
ncbi:MAG: proline dehydrogenase family protein [Chloroflexi bacterium]|nr:proline dehydrogenase family protein [Chloroflexota bacterium]